MKWLILFSLCVVSYSAAAGVYEQLLGEWSYDGFSYQNRRFPNPNPDLKLTFSFAADSTCRLFWRRAGETGFCDRKGVYELNGDVLHQTVIWLNPGNDPSCAKDPDMQLSKSSQNKISIRNGELILHLNLDGKDFAYILKKLPPSVDPNPNMRFY